MIEFSIILFIIVSALMSPKFKMELPYRFCLQSGMLIVLHGHHMSMQLYL